MKTSSKSGGSIIRADEREILLRHRHGDTGAFAELVAEYRKPVYSYLFRCGVPRRDRDDLFQEIFLRIHRSAGSYREDRPLHPWIFTIVANTVRNHFRQHRVRELVFSRRSVGIPGEESDSETFSEPSDPRPGSERRAEGREIAAWLAKQIRRLPKHQRQILLLSSVEQLPLQEIATALEIPYNTVKTRLHRARRALGQALARFQGEPSEESP